VFERTGMIGEFDLKKTAEIPIPITYMSGT
jgi:hypothetical protein